MPAVSDPTVVCSRRPDHTRRWAARLGVQEERPRRDAGLPVTRRKAAALGVLATLFGAVAVLAALLLLPAAGIAKAKSKAPRIVAAAMQDADGDGHADRLRLGYSKRVRHAADREGRYPFRVAGYRLRFVGKAAGRRIVLSLVEKAVNDPDARPVVRYRRTRRGRVRDGAGRQAVRQTFRRTRAYGNRSRTGPRHRSPTATDRDGDGVGNARDCAPRDPAIHPGAADAPDLRFTDSNCDGIDGTARDAIFVAPDGTDGDPGTRAHPKREISAAVAAALPERKDVYAAAGTYRRVEAATGVGIYGGYEPGTWARRADLVTLIVGSPEGVLAQAATRVVLQLLRVQGTTNQVNVPGGTSFYGIRALAGAGLTLQRVTVTARSGQPAGDGARGSDGANGGPGGNGRNGQCDGSTPGAGGRGGDGASGRDGGAGGRGGHDTGGIAGFGLDGADGLFGAPGGEGGPGEDPGGDGGNGLPGASGADGTDGAGGSLPASQGPAWSGANGAHGVAGTLGNGGGGGGGGGGQQCFLCDNGSGNGGGGGGGAGGGGEGGGGGGAGGGSFGLYLHDSAVRLRDDSTITPGDGGSGGRGGDGGSHGLGGGGGGGATYCSDEIGEGGDGGPGGFGGHGGGGGGGTGGPSVGILKAAGSRATLSADSVVQFGTAGSGGPGGAGGTGTGGAGAAGIAGATADTG
jgi:hypothetical protein